MPHILKNKILEILIDFPEENYNSARFDWTGKIVRVKFKDTCITTSENFDAKNDNILGKGLFNEFGIENPVGFEETEIGNWFHKIGVGLLKKDSSKYVFNKHYEIKPAKFKVISNSNKITITCTSKLINGYSYLLKKETELQENNFIIKYYLENTGEKDIITDEYVHNFIAIDKELIGENYVLNFPFQIKPALFIETVNPEQKIVIGQNEISFNKSPTTPFFFSNLSGNENIEAKWELLEQKNKVSISETGNFKTNKVNLWGSKHVVCPELFKQINLKPNEVSKWTRTYSIKKID